MSQELVVRKGMAHGTLCGKNQRNKRHRRLQGMGGSGNDPNMGRCVTSGHGSVGTGVFGGMFDLVISASHNDFIIPWDGAGRLGGDSSRSQVGDTPGPGAQLVHRGQAPGALPGSHGVSPWMHRQGMVWGAGNSRAEHEESWATASCPRDLRVSRSSGSSKSWALPP